MSESTEISHPVVQELKSYDPELQINRNEQSGTFDVSRRGHHILSADTLDNRVSEKLYNGDLQRIGPKKKAREIDAHNAKLDRESRQRYLEEVGETSERAWYERLRPALHETKRIFAMPDVPGLQWNFEKNKEES